MEESKFQETLDKLTTRSKGENEKRGDNFFFPGIFSKNLKLPFNQIKKQLKIKSFLNRR